MRRMELGWKITETGHPPPFIKGRTDSLYQFMCYFKSWFFYKMWEIKNSLFYDIFSECFPSLETDIPTPLISWGLVSICFIIERTWLYIRDWSAVPLPSWTDLNSLVHTLLIIHKGTGRTISRVLQCKNGNDRFRTAPLKALPDYFQLWFL